jgi:hypothetical protein
MDHIRSRAAGCLVAASVAVAITALSAAREPPVIVTSLTEVGLVTSHDMAAQRPVLGTHDYSRVAATLDRSVFYRAVACLEFGHVSTMAPPEKVFQSRLESIPDKLVVQRCRL